MIKIKDWIEKNVIKLSKPKGLEIGRIGLKSLIEKSPNKFYTVKIRTSGSLIKNKKMHNISRNLCLSTHFEYSWLLMISIDFHTHKELMNLFYYILGMPISLNFTKMLVTTKIHLPTYKWNFQPLESTI